MGFRGGCSAARADDHPRRARAAGLLGVAFNQMSQICFFILFGIGVDDMFIIVDKFEPCLAPWPGDSDPLSVGFACELMAAAYRRPAWLTGSYHPRFEQLRHLPVEARLEAALAAAGPSSP
jgi:hypothetical protein